MDLPKKKIKRPEWVEDGVGKENIKKCWKYLISHVSKDDVEKKADEIRSNFNHENNEKFIYGFAVNQVIANIFGGGECESLLRIENDFAKYLGFTFSTQLDDLERDGHFNKISPLFKYEDTKEFSVSSLTPSEYILEHHPLSGYTNVVIRACHFDEKTGKPDSWGIFTYDKNCMSKKTGIFEYSPLPSSRSDEWFEEFRFKTPEEAMRCWAKFRHQHNGTENAFLLPIHMQEKFKS